MKRICAIIINYKNHSDTSKCFARLQKTDLNKHLDIHVVDNSADITATSELQKLIPAENLHINYKNAGFAAGNNQIISELVSSHKYDYFLIINPDVSVPRRFFKPLLKHFIDPKVSVVAPAIRHKVHGINNYGLDGKINWRLAKPQHINLKHLRRTKAYSSQFVTFACAIFSTSVFQSVGLLDERYFMYFEDVDYCLRVKGNHQKIIMDPTVVIDHNTSSSFANHTDKVRISFYSHLLFIQKWLPFYKRILPLLYVFTLYSYLYLLGYIKRNNLKY